MFVEIFDNKKIQILYDNVTQQVSLGMYPGQFTELEHFVLARAFDLVYDDVP